MGRILRLSAFALVALGAVACADDMPPPVAAAPRPQLVERNFIVFFQTGSHHLDAAARQVLDEAAAVARSGWRPRIQVAGHTDAAGSAAYNQGLSERRAAAVARALYERGVASDQIVMIGHGEHRLLRPTADGTHDPRNRRVEIDMN
jgi:outer membrane protein OmpA-like peptidoglycan-associated protein